MNLKTLFLIIFFCSFWTSSFSNNDEVFYEYFCVLKYNFDGECFYSLPEKKKNYIDVPFSPHKKYRILDIEGEFVKTDCGYSIRYIHKDCIMSIQKITSKVAQIEINPCGYFSRITTGSLQSMEERELIQEMRDENYQIGSIYRYRVNLFFRLSDKFLKK